DSNLARLKAEGFATIEKLEEDVRFLIALRKAEGAREAARNGQVQPFSMSIQEFIARDRPQAEPLILDTDDRVLVARKSLTLLGGLGGSGKTTFFLELALHLAAGVDYLCFKMPEPASGLLIEISRPAA